jgi:hypothetical protein
MEEDESYTTTFTQDSEDDDELNESICYSLDEFSRQGMFNRVFPLEENIDYYSHFVKQPGPENIALWDWMKKKSTKDQISSGVVYDDQFNL